MLGATRSPILFTLQRIPREIPEEGMPPLMRPLPATTLRIFGVTRDVNSAPLGGCVVHLFRTMDDMLMYQTTSDGSGNYAFVCGVDSYYLVAYLPGSPDVTDATVNTLSGVI